MNDKEDQERPKIGTARLQIRQEILELFSSVEYHIVVLVDGEKRYASEIRHKHFSIGEIKQWARTFIRRKNQELRSIGVDVDMNYLGWGGNLRDLPPIRHHNV